MPIECEQLRHAPYALEECKKCGEPFPEFMRGQVQNVWRRFFGLRSYRHRLFESNVRLIAPPHPKHVVRVNRRGENRREHWENGGFITITGDVGVYCGPEAMGIDWMSGNELSQAIPPAYTEYLGLQLRAALMARTEAADAAAVAV